MSLLLLLQAQGTNCLDISDRPNTSTRFCRVGPPPNALRTALDWLCSGQRCEQQIGYGMS
jgi:hypothetical protein